MTLTDSTPNFDANKLVLAISFSTAILFLLLVVLMGCFDESIFGKLKIYKINSQHSTSKLNNNVTEKQKSVISVTDSVSWIA